MQRLFLSKNLMHSFISRLLVGPLILIKNSNIVGEPNKTDFCPHGWDGHWTMNISRHVCKYFSRELNQTLFVALTCLVTWWWNTGNQKQCTREVWLGELGMSGAASGKKWHLATGPQHRPRLRGKPSSTGPSRCHHTEVGQFAECSFA